MLFKMVSYANKNKHMNLSIYLKHKQAIFHLKDSRY